MKKTLTIAVLMLAICAAFIVPSQAQDGFEKDNLAKPAFDAIMIPSSQAMSDKLQVENAMDGDLKTSYVTHPGTYPNWVEVRWPQPVKLHKIVIDEDASGRSAEYRVDALVNGKWVQIVKPKLSNQGERIVEEFPPVETIKIRYYMLRPDGDATKAASSIRELQVCGSADWIEAAKSMDKPNWKSQWIWYPEEGTYDVTRYFRKHFKVDDISSIKEAFLQIGADDNFEVYLNGKQVGKGGVATQLYNVKDSLKQGDNLIAVKCYQGSIFEGLIAELTINKTNGACERIVTDKTWKTRKELTSNWFSTDLDETAWVDCIEEGMPPNCLHHASQKYFDVAAKESISCKLLGATPAAVKPGAKVQLNLEMRADKPLKIDYGFVIRIGEKPAGNPGWGCDYMVASKQVLPDTRTTAWVPGKSYTISTMIYVPDWAPHGSMPISVEAVGKNVVAAINDTVDGEVGSLRLKKFAKEPKAWPAVLPKTEIKYVNNQPKLHVNGKMVGPFIMTENSVPSYRAFGEHAKSGAHVWRVVGLKWINTDHGTPEDAKDDAAYFAAIDQQVNALLKVDPNAYIIVCSLLRASKEWTDDHPDDATVLADGNKINESLSSRKWKANLDGDYRGLVKHMAAQRYAGHIIGIQFEMAGETYWPGNHSNKFDTPREGIIVGDYSPEHIRAFRIWLKDRYNNDVQALRSAWKDETVTFETAAPKNEILRQEDLLAFRDPAKTRMPMDYWEFHAGVMAETTIHVGKAIKEASNGKLICGLWGFYSNGFMPATNSTGTMHHSGYTGLKQVLDSPYIDYLVVLQAYSNVRAGTPMIPITLAQSVTQNKKMLIIEYDVRTFFTLVRFTYRTYSQEETLSIVRRDVAASATRNFGLWWVGFPDGAKGRISVPWFADDKILEAQKAAKKVYDAVYKQGGTRSASQVAVFMNNGDVAGMDIMYAHKVLVSAQHNLAYQEFPKLGAPVDYYLLDDVILPNMDQYKVYVIANAYTLSPEQRQTIKSRLMKPGKTVVWLYAPGFSDTTKLSVDGIEDLTGFNVGYDVEALGPQVNLEPGHAFTSDIAAGEKVIAHRWTYDPNPNYKFGPIFYVDDPSAEVLGRYSHNGKAAYAAKNVNGANSVYLAVPFITRNALRSICKSSGVHLYAQDDTPLDASENYVMIHTEEAGCDKMISLPKASSVYDIWNRKLVAKNVTSFKANIPALDTGFYFVGTQAEVDAFAPSLKQGE